MTKYVPELLNELTRIVLTTRNDNPSVEEYQREVLPRWKLCQELQQALKEKNRPPTLAEAREVARQVLTMLRVKKLPEDEIRSRFTEAFTRSREGTTNLDLTGLEQELFS